MATAITRSLTSFQAGPDLLLSSLLILLTLPMWLIAAVMVKATSAGPVFFRQERTGQSGKTICHAQIP